jgi:hypothetical protein
MRIVLTQQALEIRLAWWQKILGLLGDITISRANIAEVSVIVEPIPEAMHSGIKVGLRLPWFYFVARTIRLDQAFIVRKGIPALEIAVSGQRPLTRVLVSTFEAEKLAEELGGRGPSTEPATRRPG